MSWEIFAEGLDHPEGPIVMPDGSVICVEVLGKRLMRAWNGKLETIAQLGGAPAGAALGPDGAVYITNVGGMAPFGLSHVGPVEDGRVERVDLNRGKVERLYDRCGEFKLSAPDDLVFDEVGGFWFTDLGKDFHRHREYGGIYYAKPDGSMIVEARYPALALNGIGLSADNRMLFTCSTTTGRVWRIPIEAPGRLVPDPDDIKPLGLGRVGELMATITGDCALDSLAVTASNSVCVATLVKGGITTVRPDGSMSYFHIPDIYTTNIAFGGKDMRVAYITMSATGKIARVQWPEPGLKLNFGMY